MRHSTHIYLVMEPTVGSKFERRKTLVQTQGAKKEVHCSRAPHQHLHVTSQGNKESHPKHAETENYNGPWRGIKNQHNRQCNLGIYNKGPH